MTRLIILAAIFLFCAPANAQSRAVFMDGNELHQECESYSPGCWGFVAGVADALESITGSAIPHTCRPLEVELRQVVDLAKNTLAENPAQRHRAAFNILAEAFAEAWPCR
jgi:hypothetical protein